MTATCAMKGCGQSATVMPEIHYWAMGYSRDAHQPMPISVGIRVCDAHADAEHDKRLIDNTYELACTACLSMGRALPARTTARVKWWRIDDPKAPHHVIERAGAPRH